MAAASTVAALALGGAGAVAFVYDGIPTEDVELHDAGVWVTNQAESVIGRVNDMSDVIDGVVGQGGGDLDVLQEGSTVLAVNTGELQVVDPATLQSTAQIVLPTSASVGLGGDEVVVTSRETGDVWALPVSQVAGYDSEATSPNATLGAGAVAVVTDGGEVFAASADAGIVQLVEDPETGTTVLESLWEGDLGDDLQITAVGDAPVVLDADNGLLLLPGGETTQVDDPKAAVLQAAGPESGLVVYADASGLVSQSLDGGTPSRLDVADGDGDPAQPVVLGQCAYGAWGGVNVFMADCIDDSQDTGALTISNDNPNASYVFRVNRGLLRLNDSANGLSWTADESLTLVDNWDDFDESVDDGDQQDEDTTEPTLIKDREPENHDPEASDDNFGARAGRTTILPVVDNDLDPDGDVLSASVTDISGARGVTITPIRDGGAVQVTVPEGMTGKFTFGYQVADGRGGTDDAVVTVAIADADTNTAPVQRNAASPSFEVEADGVMTYNVLPHWIDPEGDTIYLVAAEVVGSDQVEFSGDGELTYRATSGVTGVHQVSIVVSDGVETAQGVVNVMVVDPGEGEVVTNADYASTEAGLPVVVTPLKNDYSPSGAELRLANVEQETPGATVERDLDAGTVTVTADAPGTYYVLYAATLDSRTTLGIIRVDVSASADAAQPPIAVEDVALVAPGESVLVDVLANDSDPAGGVLVVTSVDVPTGSGLTVAVLEHRLLRVTNVSGIEEPVTLGYSVSNGMTATAQVTVIPTEPSSLTRSPKAVDDTAVVRAGDVVAVDVLANDSHPDDLEISLPASVADALPNLDSEQDTAMGEAFPSDGKVRFVAAAGASGTQRLTYLIVDSQGQTASATLTIKIVAEDAENSAPRPQEVTARAIAGTTLRVSIPLDGVDPDGDSVTLDGIDEAPELGRVIEVGDDWLTYEAYPDSLGLDTFTYTVRDSFGATGTATVRVGIAEPLATNLPPVAVADDVELRPGTQMAVAVLANDSDPEGQELALVEGSLIVSEGVEAKVVGTRVVVTAGDAEGSATVQYVVRDALGSSSYGVVRIAVTKDAEAMAPVARDDRVSGAQLRSAGSGGVDVEVLANDDDPDGVVSALEVTVDSESATVNEDGTIAVTPGADAQLIRYTITDPDGLWASAFIIVPGEGDDRPQLRDGKVIEIPSGETKTITIDDFVVTADGGSAMLTTAESVRAVHSNGDKLVVDEGTLVYTSADGYYGPDALTFQVTDGASVDDPDGKVASITIPVTVLPAENVAPTIIGATMVVADGEDASTLALSLLASDPNPDDVLTFAVGDDVPEGIDAEIVDGVLTVSLTADLAKGTELALPITVTDGVTEPQAAVIQVTVVASGRPLPTAEDDYVSGVSAGDAVVIAPLDNDFNPFSDQGPLTLLAADTASGQASVSISGDEVTITPAEGSSGTVVVTYRIVDVTGDPDREAEGRIVVTVISEDGDGGQETDGSDADDPAAVAERPDAPGRPRITFEGNAEVGLAWDAPNSNGANIEHYTVYSSDGRQLAQTTATTLIVKASSGIVNGEEYSFYVTATNVEGDSDPSPLSAAAHPNAVPDRPNAPELVFGDQSIDVTWTEPKNEGSAITGYRLVVSPAMPNGKNTIDLGAKTSHTIEGLENGVAYQVAVIAFNSASDQGSEQSEYSLSEVPAGAPFAAGKPTTAMLEPVGSRAQMLVSWTAADGNGDDVSSYDVLVHRGSEVVNTLTVSGDSLSAAIEVDTSETNYTFSVIGHNKSPKVGAESERSDERRAVIAPSAPTLVTASTPSANQSIVVAYTPGARNGALASEVSYQYQLNGSGSWIAMPANNTITSLNVGASYKVAVRGVSTVEGVTYTGASSAQSNTAVPFKPIGQATVSTTSAVGKVTFKVTAPSGNGRTITSIQYCIKTGTGTCSNWSNAGFTSGSKSFTKSGLSNGQQATITVRVTTNGEASNTSTMSKTGTALQPSATLAHSSQTRSGCSYYGGGNCPYLEVTTKNFPAGSYTYKCFENGSVFTTSSGAAWVLQGSFPANGSFRTDCWAGFERNYKVIIYGVNGQDITAGPTAW
ncbi:Ig-like domain-containing protein [Demequina sp. NBRC 110054]|uniref:Ig-like domain-containing protein n=1 Tax=Demequina sp. NBRC 110054 TaxID=1570343 RepID=UPI0009FC59AD|nr:Ig-like domain-containing protein [Demequina sp. NBRC 110054]